MYQQPKLILILLMLCSSCFAVAQSLVDDANPANETGANGVFSETIKIISESKKIFILTNNNQQLNPGDFLSLALNNKLAARALVAKTHQGQVGIKILKIYSLAQWGKLRREQEVQIIKGDDSTFSAPAPVAAPPTEVASQIKSEEDLFSSDTVVEEDLGDFDENKNRRIKPDNIISLFGSFLQAQQTDAEGGGKVRGTEIGLAWAYQFADNYFVEGAYGRTMLNSYPASGTQTLVNHMMLRLKYTFKGPLYTFFMPYAGYHQYSVSSPDAGKTDASVANAAEINRQELNAVDDLKKSGPIFGVTVLRRLVPGWFIRADLGTDLINLGFAIEF
jgi:hypothetical protein